jgi:hypothetical protein
VQKYLEGYGARGAILFSSLPPSAAAASACIDRIMARSSPQASGMNPAPPSSVFLWDPKRGSDLVFQAPGNLSTLSEAMACAALEPVVRRSWPLPLKVC